MRKLGPDALQLELEKALALQNVNPSTDTGVFIKREFFASILMTGLRDNQRYCALERSGYEEYRIIPVLLFSKFHFSKLSY